jgi:hypothetical protein
MTAESSWKQLRQIGESLYRMYLKINDQTCLRNFERNFWFRKLRKKEARQVRAADYLKDDIRSFLSIKN